MKSNNKYKELSKNTLLFSIGNIGSKLITLLLVPLYTTVLMTDEYGIIDVLNTTVALLVPILTINIQDAVLRFTLDADCNSEEVLASSSKVIGVSAFGLTLAVCTLKWFGVLKLGWIYVFFLVLSYTFIAFQNVFSMYLRARDKVSIIVTSGILTTLVTCILNVIFLLPLKMGVTGFITANLIALLVGLSYSFIVGKLKTAIIGRQLKLDLLKRMLTYSVPLLANTIAWWINGASDRYILTYLRGASVNGIYAISYKFPTILATLQGFFYNAWSVSAIKEFDENDSDGFVGNVYESYTCLSVMACSVLIFTNPVLAKLLFAKEFTEAYKYVPFLLVGTTFNGLALFEGCLFTATKKTREISRTTLIGAGINTFLNVVLIPLWGAYGAAFATMVGYLVVWVVRTYALSKIIKMKISWMTHYICLSLVLVQCYVTTFTDNVVLHLFIVILLIIAQRTIISQVVRNVGTLLKRR